MERRHHWRQHLSLRGCVTPPLQCAAAEQHSKAWGRSGRRKSQPHADELLYPRVQHRVERWGSNCSVRPGAHALVYCFSCSSIPRASSSLTLCPQAVVSASSTEISWNRDPIGGQVRSRAPVSPMLTIACFRSSETPLQRHSPAAPSSPCPWRRLPTSRSTLLPVRRRRRRSLKLQLLLSWLAVDLLPPPHRQ